MENTQAQCLSITDDEAQAIISHQSLFDGHQMTENVTVSLNELKSKMDYLTKKEIRLNWHSIALSEYWRAKQIPRGLRMNKKPSFGHKDPVFLQKWEQVLNKCSLDLTLLIIDQTKLEAKQVNAEVLTIRESIQTKIDTNEFKTMELKIKEELGNFERELKAYKIKKYERDAEDYKNGTVYDWNSRQRQRRGAPPTRRDRRNVLTSEEDTSDQGQTSDSSMGERFLGGHKRGPRNWRGRGRGVGREGRRDNSKINYALRSRNGL